MICCWINRLRLPRPPAHPFRCGGGGSGMLYLGLGAIGALLALIGLAGVLYDAVTATSWYTDMGRFGDALMNTKYGAILPGGLLLLLIALSLLAFDVLLSKRN